MLPGKKFGVYQVPVDVDQYFMQCPSCETDTWTDAMLISNYYHFYFVPIFPISKDINTICTKCGLKKNGIPFDAKHFNNYDEIKSKFKHPWYTYIGFSIAILIITLIIISSIL